MATNRILARWFLAGMCLVCWRTRSVIAQSGSDTQTAEGAQVRQKACDAGDADACYYLGGQYSFGRGVLKDSAQAEKLYQKALRIDQAACDSGKAAGCSGMGLLYEFGNGVPRDPNRAVALFQKACDGGFSKGCQNLGLMYEFGMGVPVDPARVRQAFDKGCDLGAPPEWGLGCRTAGQKERARAKDPTADLMTMSPEEIKKGIENQHPAAYYILAQKLLASGQKDEAVFWLYAGQLRFRFHVAANPNLSPSGDPALLASFNEVIGRPINEYAYGNLKALHATIDRVLAWDKDTPNGFTSKEKNAQAWNTIREGLVKLRDYNDQNADTIRKQREANGAAQGVAALTPELRDKFAAMAAQGDTRTVVFAELEYRAASHGLYADLPCLEDPKTCIEGYNGPPFLNKDMIGRRLDVHGALHPGPPSGSSARTFTSFAYTATAPQHLSGPR
jgi:hypothetical protein